MKSMKSENSANQRMFMTVLFMSVSSLVCGTGRQWSLVGNVRAEHGEPGGSSLCAWRAFSNRRQFAAGAGFSLFGGFAALSDGLVSVFAAAVSAGLASAFVASPF